VAEMVQVNPVLLAHVVGTEVFIGQTVRSAVSLGEPVEVILRAVSELRRPFDPTRPPQGTEAIAARLSQYGCLVAAADADEMQRDRLIAAWSLFAGSPTAIRDRICQASVAILGLGGVGSAVALALARSGVGRLALFDFDHVAAPNIKKSSVFLQRDISLPKVDVLASALRDTGCQIRCFHERVSDFEAIRGRARHQIDVVVWAGDDDERAVFDSLASSMCGTGAALTTGGVVEHAVSVGPTLLPDDLLGFRREANARAGSLESLLRAANHGNLNPGTHVAVHLAGGLIANEVLAAVGGYHIPPLRGRVLLLDLATLDVLKEPFTLTDNAIARR
jgi:hypothetical protein